MKQILPRLKEFNKHLAFAKRSFTKCGFRHVTQYIDSLIVLNKKTVKQISRVSLEEKHHSAISRLLTESSIKQQELEDSYLCKAKYLMHHQKKTLLLDDTLAEHNGKKIEQTQSHFDHSNNEYIIGHQFFTASIHAQTLQLPLFP
ncbi:MAG TPA: transposase [Candidatus Hodarchaeales archaeon]|nr:transposase [Candidatus Hodarchaeales archaeon]